MVKQSPNESDSVAQDDAKAVSLYRQACEAGNALSCNDLGWMYKEGRGVVRDDAQAVYLFRQACDDGNEASNKAE